MLTADEMREQARARLYKHREDMMAKGYKSTTCFVGLDIIAEFDRLRDNHGWTRHECLDHFFNCYLDSLKVKGTEPEPVIDPDEFDFEIIEPEPLATDDINLNQYRGARLTGVDLISIDNATPKTWTREDLSDSLNAIGALTGKGKSWTGKKFTQNLGTAKKNQGA